MIRDSDSSAAITRHFTPSSRCRVRPSIHWPHSSSVQMLGYILAAFKGDPMSLYKNFHACTEVDVENMQVEPYSQECVHPSNQCFTF